MKLDLNARQAAVLGMALNHALVNADDLNDTFCDEDEGDRDAEGKIRRLTFAGAHHDPVSEEEIADLLGLLGDD